MQILKFKHRLLLILVFTFLIQFVWQTISYADTPKNFLSLTDIHFTPFEACNNVKPCPLIQELNQSAIEQWENILAKYDTNPPKYGQDTTYPLVVSSLAAAKKEATAAKVEFVLVLGDFLGHDYKKNYADYSGDSSPEGYQVFVKKTFDFLTLEFQQTFPSTDVYNLVGNNDSYVDDYVFDAKGAFFKDLAVTWSDLIKTPENKVAMRKAFVDAGYYAVNLPGDQVRLICLNSNLFSIKAKGDDVLTAARTELDWLKTELETVTQHHQKAIIAMHIPLGVDVYATIKKGCVVEFWQPEFSSSFTAILTAHAADIMSLLSAHTHSDWFEILNSRSASEIPNSLTPSISPQNGNNPGFKIFNYTDQLTNFTTYIDTLDKEQTWRKEYDFNAVYQPACTKCRLLDGMKNIQQTGSIAEAYKTFFATSTDSQSITKGKWLPYYWCAIRSITAQDYQHCRDGKF